jgi:hypothetical protein
MCTVGEAFQPISVHEIDNNDINGYIKNIFGFIINSQTFSGWKYLLFTVETFGCHDQQP